MNWVQLVLAAPVIVYSGAQFYRGAWAAVRHRNADMNTLIAVGTGVAFVYSVVVTVAPGAVMHAGPAGAMTPRARRLLRGGHRDHRPRPRSAGCSRRARSGARRTPSSA